MTTSVVGVALIKEFEGCKLKAYLCPAKVPTIGYGNTFYANGAKVKMGDVITQQQADELLRLILPKYEAIVSKKVKVPLTQNQYNALVSHTFNTGGSDTLFKLINEKAGIDTIKNWWITRYIQADGKTLKGLVLRRKAEYDLYISKL
jgi:lysozyme